MKIKKITTCTVTQVYDTEAKIFVDQFCKAGDQVEYEDEEGNAVDVDSLPPDFPYMTFEMPIVPTA